MSSRNLPNDLRMTERTLKRLDVTEPEPQLPESEDYYERLHDKIMAQVDKKEILPPPPLVNRTKTVLKQRWRHGLYLVTMSVLLAVVGVKTLTSANGQMNQNHAVLKFQNEDQLIGLLKKSPDMMDKTVLSSNISRDIMSAEIYSNMDLTKELIDSL